MGRPCLSQLEFDGDARRSRSHAPHNDLLDQRIGHLDPGDLGDVATHADLGSASVDETCLWRHVQATNDEIDDRPRSAHLPRQGLECVPHLGASPLASNSSAGTRNMLSAFT